MAEYGYETYLSPFTWRYSSKQMRGLFSEKEKRLQWRQVWCALAKAQVKAGLVSKAEYDDIASHANEVDVEQSLQVEEEISHDLMAELTVFSSQCEVGGGKIHLGATSMDVEDNAESLRDKKALQLIENSLCLLLQEFYAKIEKYADAPCMAFTHLQPAEPTTLGFRFANYAQDLLLDLHALRALKENYKGKGIRGAVGTSASYVELLKQDGKLSVDQLEKEFLLELKLSAFDVTTQTIPRKQDFLLLSTLASCAQSLHRLAQDIRILQNPLFGELSEPFGKKQVGSSAMPFKKNPVMCERICSLSRLASVYPKVAWDNAATTMLERTLDDSANRRIAVSQAFLALDETLLLAIKVMTGLQVNEFQLRKNLETFAPFASTEALLMALSSKGLSRQDGHEIIRQKAMQAWADVCAGKPNPLPALLCKEPKIFTRIKPSEVERIVSVQTAIEHTGNAAEKCAVVLEKIRQACGKPSSSLARK